MLVQIFKGVSLRVKAIVAVVTGPSLFSQTVGVVSEYPALLPEIIAQAALKYRRTVTSARFRVNPKTDEVELLCAVTNVTSATVGAGLPVGQIGWVSTGPGGVASKPPTYVSATTEGKIAPHSDGELVAAMFGSPEKLKQLHLKVFLNLGPGNGLIHEFKDVLFLDF